MKCELELDIFPPIFPQPYFERMKTVTQGDPALAATLKRWLGVPVLSCSSCFGPIL